MNVLSPGSQTDLNRLGRIYADIENNFHTHDYVASVLNDIGYYQPLLLHIVNQYTEDEPVLKLYFLLWFFYRRKIRVRDIPVTSERYLLAESEIENIIEIKDRLYDNLESPGSRAMITTLLQKSIEEPDFRAMLTKTDNAIFISVCAFTRCFDAITTKRWP